MVGLVHRLQLDYSSIRLSGFGSLLPLILDQYLHFQLQLNSLQLINVHDHMLKQWGYHHPDNKMKLAMIHISYSESLT